MDEGLFSERINTIASFLCIAVWYFSSCAGHSFSIFDLFFDLALFGALAVFLGKIFGHD